ncbi:hypothetical protein J4E90_007127 [Alternaria incomplexa]|uniref:uncharacterized protein n=1 Tax=Alternaria incomplexa TaxID=1187928 RepID=UPI0022211896|nr:uncharacterized protein J4E90_007127 [Alternaria incomplexa]KAI4910871.1 hypothetical protein J4E90_007127 [Alternaria incomplexa]
MLPQLTHNDITALEELLRRKTEGIPRALKGDITLSLDAILRPSPQQQFFPYHVANVNEGATFAGFLKYRGDIMKALQASTPMQQWPEQMIVAYFCSSIERNLSFSRYRGETRTRLLANLAARLNNSDTPLQAAYTLACMEYDQHASLGPQFDPANPTKHMLRFAWHFQQHPDHFIVLNQKRTDALKVHMTQYLARVRNSPQWDKTKLAATQQLFDFSFSGGADALNEAATKGKKKRIRGKGKKGQGQDGAADAPPASSSSSAPPTFYYESTRILEHCKGNALLQGLVADMPGVRNIGSQVEIVDIGDLSAFNVLSLDEPDKSYEDDIEELYADGGENEMDIDEDVCLLDSADLDLWVKRAESGM